jgi:hypothetical protein
MQRVSVLIAFVTGLVIWMVLWAVIGAKAFDAFLPLIGLVVIAAVWELLSPVIKQYIRP